MPRYPAYITVTPHTRDDGQHTWAWRCWGSGDCNGHLHLDCGSEARAHRLASQHLADRHPEHTGSPS
jgi:hypothetical protein